MQSRNFGKVRLIPGGDGSRFPFSTSLFIDDEVKVLIDPGAGEEAFGKHLGGARVDYVLNTHYHFDHISGNHLFREARVLVNPEELEVLRAPRRVAERVGILEVYGEAGVEEWVKAISSPGSLQAPYTPAFRHEWWLSTGRVAGCYPYDEDLLFGTTRVKMVYAPGHTAGNCCAFFPDEGMVYTGDIDLTAFGPWYCGSDGDIDLFIQSARALLLLNADFFVTAHQIGVLSRRDFPGRLETFLAVVEERERKLAAILEADMGLAQVLEQGIVYRPRYLEDPWIRMWETISVRKHAERLAGKGHLPAARFVKKFFQHSGEQQEDGDQP